MSNDEIIIVRETPPGVVKQVNEIIIERGAGQGLPGPKDHTLLENIGDNTHAQIDSHIDDKNNPHDTPTPTVENIGELIAGATEGVPADADSFGFSRASADDKLYRVLWENLILFMGLALTAFFRPAAKLKDYGVVSAGTINLSFTNLNHAYATAGNHALTFANAAEARPKIDVEIVVTATVDIAVPADADFYSSKTLIGLEVGTYKVRVWRMTEDPVFNYGIEVLPEDGGGGGGGIWELVESRVLSGSVQELFSVGADDIIRFVFEDVLTDINAAPHMSLSTDNGATYPSAHNSRRNWSRLGFNNILINHELNKAYIALIHYGGANIIQLDIELRRIGQTSNKDIRMASFGSDFTDGLGVRLTIMEELTGDFLTASPVNKIKFHNATFTSGKIHLLKWTL